MAAARPALLCRRTQLALLATCNFPKWLLALKPLEPRKNALMLASDLAQRKSHSQRQCSSKPRCKVCRATHHTLLHNFNQDMMAGAETRPVNPSVQQSHQSSSPTVSMVVRAAKRGSLPTAIVQVRDRFGEYHLLRAMLDSCSEVNLITEDAAKRLQLEKFRVAQAVSGISDAIQNINYSVSTTLKSRMSNFQWTSTFAVIKSICTNQPSGNVDTSQWKFPKGIVLADPLFYESNKIHILINTEGLYESEFPVGASVLRTDFYVDDLLTGADAIDDLKEKKDQIIALVEKANLQMTKFQSNSADLIASFDHEVPIKVEEEGPEFLKRSSEDWPRLTEPLPSPIEVRKRTTMICNEHPAANSEVVCRDSSKLTTGSKYDQASTVESQKDATIEVRTQHNVNWARTEPTIVRQTKIGFVATQPLGDGLRWCPVLGRKQLENDFPLKV
ncbi:hypothetical protein ACLKA6_000718 [Drosophila palustris]